MDSCLLPSCYFAPLNYFTRVLDAGIILTEQSDHYRKQSYRNRCVIFGANGLLVLSVPVVHLKAAKTLMKDVKIDPSASWQKLHYRGIVSAYRSAPFFEYYFDLMEGMYFEKHQWLVDLNRKSLEIALKMLGISAELRFTVDFQAVNQDSDPRFLIDPKVPMERDRFFRSVPYKQVFSDRHGFQPNLSILDLVFNCGPGAVGLLREMRMQSA